jgi:hypothetical protein
VPIPEFEIDGILELVVDHCVYRERYSLSIPVFYRRVISELVREEVPHKQAVAMALEYEK